MNAGLSPAQLIALSTTLASTAVLNVPATKNPPAGGFLVEQDRGWSLSHIHVLRDIRSS